MIGAVKLRLAADIGDFAAWRFYRRTTRDALDEIARDPRWRTSLSVTPRPVRRRRAVLAIRG